MTTWHSRGYLPHIDGSNLIQHITFHLADSLPRQAIARMQREIEKLPDHLQELERRKRIQDLLDANRGSCLLRRDEFAEMVQDSLFHGDGNRYRLIAWVIMPNHVHVMLQLAEYPLSKIVQSWLSISIAGWRWMGAPISQARFGIRNIGIGICGTISTCGQPGIILKKIR
jgi:type I restriction enzyme R subunit/putative DNA methylase